MDQTLSKIFGGLEDDGMGGLNTVNHDDKKFKETWTGKVVDNKDPFRMGRVKIRIFGRYDGVDDAALPWAMPECAYLGSSTANLVIPTEDAIVRGYFENGDPYKPIYTGMITQMNPVEAAVKAFTGLASPGETILDEATNDLDYPNVMVLGKTDDGEAVIVNRSNGQIKINHRSGLKIQIDPNGSITVEQSMSKKITNPLPAKMDVTIEGDTNLTANGDVNLTAKMNVNINGVTGDVNLGRNGLKQLICAHPVCFVTGAPTNGGNTNVKA